MDLAVGDGVGAIEVCLPEMIDRKIAYRPPSEDELKLQLADAEPGFSVRRFVEQLSGIDDGTSLGGEKPKLTITRQSGSSTQWWIAKLQERGAAPFLPAMNS
jgi:serine/threonine-protein kinase HipA